MKKIDSKIVFDLPNGVKLIEFQWSDKNEFGVKYLFKSKNMNPIKSANDEYQAVRIMKRIFPITIN